jgi:hypothetical protein
MTVDAITAQAVRIANSNPRHQVWNAYDKGGPGDQGLIDVGNKERGAINELVRLLALNAICRGRNDYISE